MALERYRAKRNFEVTPEPSGEEAAAAERLRFVVQKHAARRLHYDFRLELDGVLKSWAVPKGPSFDPAQKRLAVHVEDHPVEYGSFEGVIPPKQYGAGNVMLWDHGTWEPIGDPHEGYRKGRLKFRLYGERLHGAWTLVRTSRRDEDDKDNWLLIKEADEEARSGADAEITAREQDSVVSGRTIDEIGTRTKGARKAKATFDLAKLPGAVEAEFPAMIKPQLATLAQVPPRGAEWIYEIKQDGYRILCRVANGRATVHTRTGLDWTSKFAPQAAQAARLPVKQAWLDGEMVVLESNGVSSFQALQNALEHETPEKISYFVFDLLYLDGWDLRRVPLTERKRVLAQLLEQAQAGSYLKYSDHLTAQDGASVLQHACGHGLEGVIAKRADAGYVSGRGTDWLKLKCRHRQEFVVGGYTLPKGSRSGFGCLLLGLHEADGSLNFCGRVGSGFNEQMLDEMTATLESLRRNDPPFRNPPREKTNRWVEPQLVAEVEFANWTDEGLLRQASFIGLREDKPAVSVHAEKTVKKAPSPRKQRAQSAPQVAGVALSNSDRILYPDAKLTKLDVARYYEYVADRMLPYVTCRPIALVRCPQGADRQCFFQKQPHSIEDHLGECPVSSAPEEGSLIVVNDTSDLVELVQNGALEIHIWGSATKQLDRPDRVVFDLDPDAEVPWTRTIETAQLMRALLHELELESFLKTTGGKGLHVVVPLEPREDWDTIKAFARTVAEYFERQMPERYTAKLSKTARPGKIFIDWLRNYRGSTSVAPYSTRVRPAAPVSVPVSWDELTAALRSDMYTVENVRARLEALERDPWEEFLRERQRLDKSLLRKLGARR